MGKLKQRQAVTLKRALRLAFDTAVVHDCPGFSSRLVHAAPHLVWALLHVRRAPQRHVPFLRVDNHGSADILGFVMTGSRGKGFVNQWANAGLLFTANRGVFPKSEQA